MAYCGKCGLQVEENVKFCPGCGGAIGAEQAQQKEAPKTDFEAKFQNFNNTQDNTKDYEAKDIAANKVMGILSYLSLLVLVPIFGAKNSKFARFHANQGLVLLIAWIGWNIVSSIIRAILTAISWRLYVAVRVILGLVTIVFVVLSVLGIINAAGGKAKELPLIGKFKILK